MQPHPISADTLSRRSMADSAASIARAIAPFLGHRERIAELEAKIAELEEEILRHECHDRRVEHFVGHARYSLQQYLDHNPDPRDGADLRHVMEMLDRITLSDSWFGSSSSRINPSSSASDGPSTPRAKGKGKGEDGANRKGTGFRFPCALPDDRPNPKGKGKRPKGKGKGKGKGKYPKGKGHHY